MLYSMTGFGAAVCKDENLSVSVELKTVNNRFFKLAIRSPEGYGAWDQRIESLIRKTVERGTVNVHIRFAGVRSGTNYQINTSVLQSYIKQLGDASAVIGQPHHELLPLTRLVMLPGVIVTENENEETEKEKIWVLLEKAICESLNSLQLMRRTEGDSMKKDLTANVELLRRLIGSITDLAPRIAPLYQQKLKERIEKMLADHGLPISDADFMRELAIYADRCDISEELVRFQSHLEQFTSAMQSKESCGRKLDFLTQELFREVNTTGAKANDADITKHVVEIKTVIERIREMVQNIE